MVGQNDAAGSAGSAPCAAGLSHMKTSSCRRSIPPPCGEGGWPKFLIWARRVGVATMEAVLGATPTPASASGRCCASPPLGRPSPQGGGIQLRHRPNSRGSQDSRLNLCHMQSPWGEGPGSASVTVERLSARKLCDPMDCNDLSRSALPLTRNPRYARISSSKSELRSSRPRPLRGEVKSRCARLIPYAIALPCAGSLW
jgi:hypothetical protein